MPEKKVSVRYRGRELAEAVGHFGDNVQVLAEVEIDGRIVLSEALAVEFVRVGPVPASELPVGVGGPLGPRPPHSTRCGIDARGCVDDCPAATWDCAMADFEKPGDDEASA